MPQIIRVTDRFSGPFEEHEVTDPNLIDSQVRDILDQWCEGNDQVVYWPTKRIWTIETTSGPLDWYAEVA